MKFYIGIDIGGTTTKLALVDANKIGQVYATGQFDSGQRFNISPLIHLEEAIKKLLGEHRGQLLGVGIGCTGPVDIHSGLISNPYTLPTWGHVKLTNLSEIFDVPVFIDNDANTAHLGEVVSRPSTPKNTVMLTFGTGVGVSMRIDGTLFRGKGDQHPETGHLSVDQQSSDTCYCGRNNCLENILSGTAINRDLQAAGLSLPQFLQPENRQIAESFLSRWRAALGHACANLALLFGSELIFIGGGMAEIINSRILPKVQLYLDTFPQHYGRTKCLPAALGNQAGVIGAAYLAKLGRKNR